MASIALSPVLEALNEIKEDATLPKNIRAKVDCMINILEQDMDDSIKINKAMHEIEGMTEDSNMQSYTMTQIYRVVSLLEMVK